MDDLAFEKQFDYIFVEMFSSISMTSLGLKR